MFKFDYEVGRLFWKFFVRHGATPVIFVQILWDDEAKVFVAHNSNLKGLVTSAPTPKELLHNINEVIEILLEDALNKPAPSHPKLESILELDSSLCKV